jgi:hypothetical protein
VRRHAEAQTAGHDRDSTIGTCTVDVGPFVADRNNVAVLREPSGIA